LFMFLIVVLMLKFGVKVNLTFLFASIVICGDLTEVYVGSLKPWVMQKLGRA
jgi:hypothetical protein